jgi:hypothetical protein
MLTSKKTDPRNDKNARFLNNLGPYEKHMEQAVNENAPLKTYQDLSSLRENSKPGYKFKD